MLLQTVIQKYQSFLKSIKNHFKTKKSLPHNMLQVLRKSFFTMRITPFNFISIKKKLITVLGTYNFKMYSFRKINKGMQLKTYI